MELLRLVIFFRFFPHLPCWGPTKSLVSKFPELPWLAVDQLHPYQEGNHNVEHIYICINTTGKLKRAITSKKSSVRFIAPFTSFSAAFPKPERRDTFEHQGVLHRGKSMIIAKPGTC